MSCEVCRLGCCVLAEIISFAHGGILITCILPMDCVCHEQATIQHKNCLPDRSRYSSNVSRVPFQFIWSQRLFGAIVVLGRARCGGGGANSSKLGSGVFAELLPRLLERSVKKGLLSMLNLKFSICRTRGL